MAIVVTNKSGSPIKVTGTTNTHDEILFPTQGVGVFIRRVYWYVPATAGHLLALKTKDGSDILLMRCEADSISQSVQLESYFPNIYCDDMDSGTLYIYIK